MGGGAAIRAAAKAAAYKSPAIFAGPAAVRRTSFPSSSTVSSVAAAAGPPEAGISAVTSDKSRSEAAVQRPPLDLDDWEFAGWAAAAAEEEQQLFVEAVDQAAPRLVFGSVPSFEEAKAATADLKHAIQRTTISHATATDSAIIPQMPGHVLQAFAFLQGSPEAQDVVASLACDTNVWNAVMSNEKVLEFYNNHQPAITRVDTEDSTEVNSNAFEDSSADSNESSGFKRFINNFKIKVEEVVKNISGFFHDIWASSPASSGAKSAQNNAGSYTEAAVGVGATFFALAVATILVVLFKRA